MVLALNYNMLGVNIRSENAAKPHTMPSRYLCEYIRSIEKNGHALDFGCGKLRYSDELISKFDEVTFLDSKRQLEREQIIRGIKTKIIDYVPRYYKNANTVAFEDVDKIIGGYDFILCSNVLSAVPCRDTIDKIVLSIKRLLKSGGETLIVNQYKSSYFKKYETGRKHLYGYIYKNSKSVSYYGLLDELAVQEICSSHGLEILKSWSKAGSSYVTVGSCNAI